MFYRKRILILFTYILFGLFIIYFTRLPQSAIAEYRNNPQPEKGFQAPDFSLQSIQGDFFRLNDLRGKVIILNFWASWCPPCRYEMPTFQKIFNQYRNQNVVLLTINVTAQDSMSSLETFINKYNLTFPILLDKDGKVSRAYQIQSLPSTFIIDTNGIIQDIIYGGPVSETLLQIRINQALKQ
ncbi:MAG: peroxiredoxin family protein [Anaerolineales bacterium]